jgi:hypothetical protein
MPGYFLNIPEKLVKANFETPFFCINLLQDGYVKKEEVLTVKTVVKVTRGGNL